MTVSEHGFKSLRQWRGSQYQAFEELCYQLRDQTATPTPGGPTTGLWLASAPGVRNRGSRTLQRIRPLHVAAYIEQLQHKLASPSVKQHLAAIRMLFDWLVIGQIVPVNPATSVRGPKHVVKKGKTPVLSAEEARQLSGSGEQAIFRFDGADETGYTISTDAGDDRVTVKAGPNPVPWYAFGFYGNGEGNRAGNFRADYGLSSCGWQISGGGLPPPQKQRKIHPCGIGRYYGGVCRCLDPHQHVVVYLGCGEAVVVGP